MLCTNLKQRGRRKNINNNDITTAKNLYTIEKNALATQKIDFNLLIDYNLIRGVSMIQTKIVLIPLVLKSFVLHDM
jgi:hypothetical protein